MSDEVSIVELEAQRSEHLPRAVGCESSPRDAGRDLKGLAQRKPAAADDNGVCVDTSRRASGEGSFNSRRRQLYASERDRRLVARGRGSHGLFRSAEQVNS